MMRLGRAALRWGRGGIHTAVPRRGAEVQVGGESGGESGPAPPRQPRSSAQGPSAPRGRAGVPSMLSCASRARASPRPEQPFLPGPGKAPAGAPPCRLGADREAAVGPLRAQSGSR